MGVEGVGYAATTVIFVDKQRPRLTTSFLLSLHLAVIEENRGGPFTQEEVGEVYLAWHKAWVSTSARARAREAYTHSLIQPVFPSRSQRPISSIRRGNDE